MAFHYVLKVKAFNDSSTEEVFDECHYDGREFTKAGSPAAFEELPDRISSAVAKYLLVWSEYYDHVTTYLYEIDEEGKTDDRLVAEYFGY